MGIPISPDDPINGACPTCIPWMPSGFDIVWTITDLGTFEGSIDIDPEQPGHYNGALEGPAWPFPIPFSLTFCWTSFGAVHIISGPGGGVVDDALDIYCNVPFDVETGLGNFLSVS